MRVWLQTHSLIKHSWMLPRPQWGRGKFTACCCEEGRFNLWLASAQAGSAHEARSWLFCTIWPEGNLPSSNHTALCVWGVLFFFFSLKSHAETSFFSREEKLPVPGLFAEYILSVESSIAHTHTHGCTPHPAAISSLKWMQVVTLFSSIKSSLPAHLYSSSLTLNTPQWHFSPSVACVYVCFVLFFWWGQNKIFYFAALCFRGQGLCSSPAQAHHTKVCSQSVGVCSPWKSSLCFSLANKKSCNKTVPGQKALPKSANQSYHIGILVQSNS